MFNRRLALALAASYIFLPLESLAQESLFERSAREARALFGVAVNEDLAKTSRCQIASDWFREGIPPEIARKRLGVKLDALAELVAPIRPVPGTHEILDPAGVHAEAFCTREERELFVEELRQAVDAGEVGGGHSFRHTDYGYPVFDSSFRRAVFVVSHGGCLFLKTPDGVRKRGCHLNTEARAYVKTRGQWRIVEVIQLGMT